MGYEKSSGGRMNHRASDHEAGAEAVHSRSQRGAAYFEAALPRHHAQSWESRADDITMHSSGSGDRDATEAQDKTAR